MALFMKKSVLLFLLKSSEVSFEVFTLHIICYKIKDDGRKVVSELLQLHYIKNLDTRVRLDLTLCIEIQIPHIEAKIMVEEHK
jgi:hypothetical protein